MSLWGQLSFLARSQLWRRGRSAAEPVLCDFPQLDNLQAAVFQLEVVVSLEEVAVICGRRAKSHQVLTKLTAPTSSIFLSCYAGGTQRQQCSGAQPSPCAKCLLSCMYSQALYVCWAVMEKKKAGGLPWTQTWNQREPRLPTVNRFTSRTSWRNDTAKRLFLSGFLGLNSRLLQK